TIVSGKRRNHSPIEDYPIDLSIGLLEFSLSQERVKLRLARRSISRAELESLYTEGVPAKILFSGIGCVGTQTREEETFSRICRFSRAFPRNLPSTQESTKMDQETSLYLWDLDSSVKEPELFPNSLISVEIYKDERNHSLGKAKATFRERETDVAIVVFRSINAYVKDITLPLGDSVIGISVDSFPPHMLNNEAEHDLTNVGNSDSLQTPANTLSNHTELDIYVGNISAATTAEKLMAEFGHYGLVIDAKVVKKAGISYGFAKFEDPENSFAAIQALNGKVIDGNAWRVEKVHKNKKQMREVEIRGAMEEGRVLYASNLSYQVKDSDLERFFGQFGDIVACRIRRLSDGRSRGDAFIEYSTKESVARAILAMEGKTVWGRPIYVGLGKINP
ncbi:unnamed protein product, partial [Thlaspi arvense]